jgi:hypothetical protein
MTENGASCLREEDAGLGSLTLGSWVKGTGMTRPWGEATKEVMKQTGLCQPPLPTNASPLEPPFQDCVSSDDTAEAGPRNRQPHRLALTS